MPVFKKHGYKKMKHGDGFEIITETHTHYATTYWNEGVVQIWGYSKEDGFREKLYDTGIITVTVKLLDTLLDLFLTNHK